MKIDSIQQFTYQLIHEINSTLQSLQFINEKVIPNKELEEKALLKTINKLNNIASRALVDVQTNIKID